MVDPRTTRRRAVAVRGRLERKRLPLPVRRMAEEGNDDDDERIPAARRVCVAIENGRLVRARKSKRKEA